MSAFLTKPISQARRKPASAQNEITRQEGWVVGVVVFDRQAETRYKNGVFFVGSCNGLTARLDVLLERPFDPCVGFLGFPPFEGLGEDRKNFRRIKIADDDDFTMVGTEVIVIEAGYLFGRSFLDALDLFVDGGNIANVFARIRREDPLNLVESEPASDRSGPVRDL